MDDASPPTVSRAPRGEQAAALGDPGEIVEIDAGAGGLEAVVLGQLGRQPCLLRGEELDERTVLIPRDRLEERRGLVLHGVTEVGRPVGEARRIAHQVPEAAEVQPIPNEHQRGLAGARMREHAIDLGDDVVVGAKRIGFGRIEQCVVGRPGPQKVAQAGGQLEAVECPDVVAGGLVLEPVQKRRCLEHHLQRQACADLERFALGLRRREDRDQPVDLLWRQRAAKHLAPEVGDELALARILVLHAAGVLTHEGRERGDARDGQLRDGFVRLDVFERDDEPAGGIGEPVGAQLGGEHLPGLGRDVDTEHLPDRVDVFVHRQSSREVGTRIHDLAVACSSSGSSPSSPESPAVSPSESMTSASAPSPP